MNLFTPLQILRRSKKSRLDVVREAHEAQHRKERNFIERTLNVPIHKFTDYNSYLQAGCSKVWASFRACHLTANTVLGAEFKIMAKNAKGDSTTEVTQPEITRFLTTPNPYDSWEEMIYMWTFHMKLTGNCYWLKDEINPFGQPLALYPLLPQHMKVVPDAKTKVQKYTYTVNGKTIDFSPEEIVHFRRPHPSDLIFGLGDIEPSETLYNDYINRKALEEKFIENGATPSGVMSREEADEMDDTDWAKLKAKWTDEYGGKKNAGKVMFLSGKWTFNKLGLTHQEMESLEKEKLTVEQIFMNHGVPLSLAGVRESANYATARVEEMNFRKYEVVPLIRLLVAKLNQEKVFITNFNPNWRLDFNLAGLVDVEQVWKDYGQLFLNGGMTANELRKQMGLDEMDDPLMDVVYIGQGRIPLEMAGLVPEPNIDSSQTDPNAPAAAEPLPPAKKPPKKPKA